MAKLNIQQQFSIYVTIQRFKFNLCAKLEYRIKHLWIKHRFYPTSQREQNRHFLINWHYVCTKTLNIIIFIYDELLAPQSKQMKHNKCCHWFRRWMPAVWEIIWWLCSGILKQHFQMLCNEIGPLVSQFILSHCAKSTDFFDAHGGIYSVNVFPL